MRQDGLALRPGVNTGADSPSATRKHLFPMPEECLMYPQQKTSWFEIARECGDAMQHGA
jgi:hypothetical protein